MPTSSVATLARSRRAYSILRSMATDGGLADKGIAKAREQATLQTMGKLTDLATAVAAADAEIDQQMNLPV
jgi:hypothetical protein